MNEHGFVLGQPLTSFEDDCVERKEDNFADKLDENAWKASIIQLDSESTLAEERFLSQLD